MVSVKAKTTHQVSRGREKTREICQHLHSRAIFRVPPVFHRCCVVMRGEHPSPDYLSVSIGRERIQGAGARRAGKRNYSNEFSYRVFVTGLID